MNRDEFLRQLREEKPKQSAKREQFLSALRQAEQPEVPQNESDKGFMRGMHAGLYTAGSGIRELFGDLSPEEREQLKREQEFLKKQKMLSMENFGAGVAMLPAYAAIAPMGGAGLAGMLGRSLVSGLVGGATTPGDIEERGKSAAYGAAGQALGEAAPIAIGRGAKAVKRTLDPLFVEGRKNIMSDMLKRQLGTAAPEVAAELEAYQPRIAGSQLTASEAAPTSGGLGALQSWAKTGEEMQLFKTRELMNQQARRNALLGIARTPEEMAAAKAERQAVTRPMYEAAESISVPVDEELRGILNRAAMKDVLKQAEAISSNYGEPISKEMRDMILTGEVPGEITGSGLHKLKTGLDSYMSGVMNDKEMLRSVQSISDAFEKWREANIPEYAAAQQKYAEMSRPINQMQIGQSLYEKLAPALADESQNYLGEYANRLSQSLRPEAFKRLAKSATGFKGASPESILTPEQMATLSALNQELGAVAGSRAMGAPAGSNTFQNLAIQSAAESLGLGGGLSPLWLSKVPGLRGAIAKTDVSLKQDLANALLDPAMTAALIRREPKGLSAMLMRAPYGRAGGALGAAAATDYNIR